MSLRRWDADAAENELGRYDASTSSDSDVEELLGCELVV